MDIVIRKISKAYLEDNINAFINIIKNEYGEYWREEHFLRDLPMKYDISLMALINNNLVGYVIASEKESNAYIHKFMIKEDYRGMGVGASLQKEFNCILYKKDMSSILLSVYSENTNGIKFYEGKEYKKVQERLDKEGKKLFIMKKELSNENCHTPA